MDEEKEISGRGWMHLKLSCMSREGVGRLWDGLKEISVGVKKSVSGGYKKSIILDEEESKPKQAVTVKTSRSGCC